MRKPLMKALPCQGESEKGDPVRRKKGHRGAMEILCLAMALGMIGCWAGELDQLFPRVSLPFFVFLIAVPGLALLAFWAGNRFLGRRTFLRLRGEPSGFPERRRLWLLLPLAVVPRVVWWIAFPQVMDSDYSLYLRMAEHYARTGAVLTGDYVLKIAPNAALYSVLLGSLMRLFGTGAPVAQGACMVLHVGNIFLLYALGKRLISSRRAFLAAAVFALLPENVFYSTLPGNEALALGLNLLGLWMLLPLLGGEKPGAESEAPEKGRRPVGYAALRALAGGGVLAFSACIRPNAWVILGGAAIWLLRSCCGRRLLPHAAALVAFTLGIAGVLLWHQGFLIRTFLEEKPAGGIGWALYEGLDLESGGKWTEQKSKRCIEVIERYDGEEADRIFYTEAMERFRSYSLGEKIRMFLRKGGSLWYESRYAVLGLTGSAHYWLLVNMAGASWFVCLMAWVYGLLCRAKAPASGSGRRCAALCAMIILPTALWHEVGSSVGRYHYMLIPFVLLMTVALFPGRTEQGRKGNRNV